jgi:hypothetical protein
MISGEAKIDDYPDSGNTTQVDTILRRKAFFIHGTDSDHTRWEMYPETVKKLLKIASIDIDRIKDENIAQIKESDTDYYNLEFDWKFVQEGATSGKQLNGYLNTVIQRKVAAKRLVELVKEKGKEFDEIVLIGHSHGGNVAIQAINAIKANLKVNVYLITVATPAYNEKEIGSVYYNIDLPKIEGEGFPVIESGEYTYRIDMGVYTVPLKFSFLKFSRKAVHKIELHSLFIPSKAIIFKYLNVENPDNVQSLENGRHIALWNNKDWVDNIAWLYDHVGPISGMTSNSANFKSIKTTNVELDINASKELKDNREKLLYPSYTFVYNEIIDAIWCKSWMKGNAIARYPLSPKIDDFKNEFQLDLNPFWKTMQEDNVADMKSNDLQIRDMAYKLSKLFDEEYKLAAKLKRDFDEDSLIAVHSFDTALPQEIQKAIDDGRIIPFPKTVRERTKKQYK